MLLHLLQTGMETVGGTMYTVLDRMTRAHDSHTEVVGSMSKHGGCSPLSIIEYVQTLHSSHDALVALVQELPVLAEKKLYNPAAQAQAAAAPEAPQVPEAPPRLSRCRRRTSDTMLRAIVNVVTVLLCKMT